MLLAILSATLLGIMLATSRGVTATNRRPAQGGIRASEGNLA